MPSDDATRNTQLPELEAGEVGLVSESELPDQEYTDPTGGLAPSLPPPDKLVGRTIDGRYLVEDVLGEGGMGLVYRAKHTILNKPLAIKVLRNDVSKDEEIIRRFRQEAQSATAIGNQHIIDIIDFGTLPDSSTYFVMEFLDGQDLTSAIEEGAMSTDRVVHIARQLCRALGAAHEAGIVHRDLKPDNIYLVSRGEDADFVKVLDFGIAKVGSGTQKLTKAGAVFGTPHYMSPEQCAGTGTDQRTDIYALGVILFEMVTGSVPFNADNLMGILTKHMYEAPVPPSALRSDLEIDPDLEAIVLRCMAKDPEGRYQTTAELLTDLERFENGVAPKAVFIHNDDDEFPLPSAKRSQKVKMVAGIAVVGVVSVAAAIMISGGEPTEPPKPTNLPQAAAPPVPVEAEAETVRTVGFHVVPAADVFKVVNGAEKLVGSTPFEVPAPESDEEYVLKAEGYEDMKVLVLPTSSDFILELNKKPDKKKPKARAKPKPRPKAEPTEKKQKRRKPDKPSGDGVLDPWAN